VARQVMLTLIDYDGFDDHHLDVIRLVLKRLILIDGVHRTGTVVQILPKKW
jgi:hypothetical protein